MVVELIPLKEQDRNQFILDNQEAFNYGALEEFGRRDDHFEEEEQIISRETIERSIEAGEAYRIVADGEVVGGVILRTDGDRGDLDILFVSPSCHNKYHRDPNEPEEDHGMDDQFPAGMFRFEKRIGS